MIKGVLRKKRVVTLVEPNLSNTMTRMPSITYWGNIIDDMVTRILVYWLNETTF